MKRRYLANKKEFTVRQVRLIMECLGACPVHMSSEWGIHSPGACPIHSSSACPVHSSSGCPVHLSSACPIHLSSACFMNFIPGWEAWHEAIKGGIWKIIGNCTKLHSIAHLPIFFVVPLHQ